MSEESEQQAETQPSGNTETGSSSNQEIDRQALAEKVYKLLKEEARIERERLGRRRP